MEKTRIYYYLVPRREDTPAVSLHSECLPNYFLSQIAQRVYFDIGAYPFSEAQVTHEVTCDQCKKLLNEQPPRPRVAVKIDGGTLVRAESELPVTITIIDHDIKTVDVVTGAITVEVEEVDIVATEDFEDRLADMKKAE